MTGLDPISAGFWLANMGRQPGNAVALVDWGLGIKWGRGMEANYGRNSVQVASMPVTLLPVTKRVSLTNYVAALPLLHSVTEGRS